MKPYCERCILIVVPQQEVRAKTVDKGFTFVSKWVQIMKQKIRIENKNRKRKTENEKDLFFSNQIY